MKLKITYYIDTPEMTDEEYEDQEDLVVEIPLSKLIKLLKDEIPNGEHLVEVLDIEII